MKLKNLIAGVCALCGIVFSASAELPAGYTQVASVKTDGAQFVNLNYTWKANSSATNEITPKVTVNAGTDFSMFLSGVAADVRLLKIFEDETLVCDFVPGVENTSGDFGLYDRERGMFCPLVRPAEAASVALVDDHETLNGPYVYAGQVLKHNHRYFVTEDTTIDAAAMPGVSAVRVPVGAAVVIDIAKDVTLTVKGGPGYGRIPGGAGIEVPRGAKLVVTGAGELDAIGGAAAAGGTGYGGMGGQFSCIQMSSNLDPAHAPYANMPEGYTDVTNNGVAASSFASDALYFARTGEGGNGGDGGGGAGAGIGTKGGTGGLGGGAALGKFVIGGDYYADDKERYADFATFFGMDIDDWYIYEEGKNVAWNGLNGGNGGNGDSALSCGEIIIASNVTVNAQSGLGGKGGENGPFGSTAQAYDKGVSGGNTAYENDVLNVTACVSGWVGTIFGFAGLFPEKSAATVLGGIGSGFGFVSGCLSIASLINQAVNDDVKTMKKQLWFVGGGGGGGGSGGGAGARIGAGGFGGAGGGAGGGGFFEMGVGSVYTMEGGFIGDYVDVTKPPLQLSGHGGLGGKGAAGGKDASSDNRGEAKEDYKGQDDDVYNCMMFYDPAFGTEDWRLGASSWQKGAEAFSGKGGEGGESGEPNTAQFSFLCYDKSKILNLDKMSQQPENLSDAAIAYRVNYYKGCVDNENPLVTGNFICGTIVESAPVIKGPDGKTFDGFYTEKDGKGVQYFDRFRNPSGFPKITTNLNLYAKWTDNAVSTGFMTVKDGASLSAGAELQNGIIYRFSTGKEFKANVGSGLKVAANATAVIYIDWNVTVTCTGADGSGVTPGYPGIEVPEGATLIVTGEGDLEATGGNAGNGSAGSPGGDGAYKHPGDGGAGGAGGGGAGAGIGGIGGSGGSGGASVTWAGQGKKGHQNSNPGNEGSAGGAGFACGTVYLLGQVEVNAKGGAGGVGGEGGDGGVWYFERHDLVTMDYGYGGGAGGGGGGGGFPAVGIGGGGAGGGGGGSGGSGSGDDAHEGDDIYDWRWNGHSGEGGRSWRNESNGKQGDDGVEKPSVNPSKGWVQSNSNERDPKPGAGGSSGAVGSAGANGGLYINEAVVAVDDTLNGRYGDIKYAFGHPALERTMTFHLDKTEIMPEMDVTVAAQIGMPLPILPDSCVRPAQLRGYVLAGAYEVKNGVSNWWYKAKGEPAKSQYEGLDDVRLTVSYVLDTERLADVPESRSFNYNGSNQVAFVAARNPGCTYLAGATNGTETGSYEYSVRLNDDYTLWSDFYTNRVRTISWEITRAPITNEWVNNIITYDWTKSRAANWEAITNNPEKTLGFKLPPDAQVAFELDPNISTREDEQNDAIFNVQRLIVRLSGMTNYFDKNYYGTYTCAQPFQIKLRPHYPWAAKLDFICEASSVKPDPEDYNRFLEAYAASPIIAQTRVPDVTGGEKVVTLNERDAYTVWDVMGSGAKRKSMTIDLSEVEGLEGVRAYSLPVYVSVDGQVFQGGSTTIDTTAEMKDGYPLYTVHDVKDIFDIACSVAFVGSASDLAQGSHAFLTIGSWEKPGDWFAPQTMLGSYITDSYVRWTPTRAGQYMLEHCVSVDNPDGTTGYRRAYFNFCGEGGSEPNLERNLITRAKVTRAATGETIDYTSLAAAVADLRYGDAITVVEDVQMENAKIPSGSTVTVGANGVFRKTLTDDLARPYHAADVTMGANGKVTKAVYHLDEEKVRTTIVGGDPFGLSEDANGRVFSFTIDNVKPDLYYVVRRSDDIRTWTVVDKVFANGTEETMPISVPAEGDTGFYSVAVTDEPSSPFQSADDGQGGVALTGITAATEVATDGRLVLPAEIDGKPVTGVALSTFDASELVELVIPASVRTVEALDLSELKTLRFLGKPDQIGDLVLSPDCIAYVPQDAGWTDVPSNGWHSAQLEYWVDFSYTTEKTDNGYEISITGISPERSESPSGDGYQGCGSIPPDERLRIPQEIGGVPVTAIAAEAFKDCKVTSVLIPEGVREIGGGAFCGCDLTSLELPASLVRLGRNAFGEAKNLSALESLTFKGDAPDYGGDIGLNSGWCEIHVFVGSDGWGETWQGCPVCRNRAQYVGAAGVLRTVENPMVVGPGTSELKDGWYVLSEDVQLGGLAVNGAANLILTDGRALTVNGLLKLPFDKRLTIYGQQKGTGALNVIAAKPSDTAVGTTDAGAPCGMLTVHGGQVTISGSISAGNGARGADGRSEWGALLVDGEEGGRGGAVEQIEISGGIVNVSGNICGGNGGRGGNGYFYWIGDDDIKCGDGGDGGRGGSVILKVAGGTLNVGGSVRGGSGGSPGNAVMYGGSSGSSGSAGLCLVAVAGGSFKAGSVQTQPVKSVLDDVTVYCVTVPGLAPDAAVTLGNLPGYGTNDIFADAGGKIYLYLPNGTYSFTANGKSYAATVANGPTTAVAQ